MYKMKEVCQQTGLTEKTVRFYVEQRLVDAKVESGLHYQYLSFNDRDIQRLKDIAALRSAEFSIADIRRMLEDPACIPVMIGEKERDIDQKIATLKLIRSNLSSLTVADRTDVAQVADAIEPRSPRRRETPKHNRLLWLAVYTALFLVMALSFWLSTRGTGTFRVWWVCLVLTLMAGIWFPIMGLGYLRYNRRYRKAPNRGMVRVVSIIPGESVEEFWEDSGWDALRLILTMGFLHWDWVRPDHWTPLVQFLADGEIVTTAYRYGGLKGSWKVGQQVEVAWYPGKEKQIYPCGDPVIRRKGWWYLLGGLGMLVFTILYMRSLSR